MRYLFIFRGDNEREQYNDRMYTNILIAWGNIKETLIDDTINNGHTCDIAFITYESSICDRILEVINPKYFIVKEKFTQYDNARDVLTFIKDKKNDYDRVFILRCDIAYKYHLSKWPRLEQNGIFFICRDIHWPSLKFCMDFLIIVDNEYIDILHESVFNIYTKLPTLHGLGTLLYEKNIPHIYLYDDYYHGHTKNPLISWLIMNDLPDLKNPEEAENINHLAI